MSRVFIHYEAEPAFTLKLVLGQSQLSTVGDVVEHFIAQYNEKNPQTTLSAQNVILKLENKSSKPFAFSSPVSVLARHEDLYVLPNPAATPQVASVSQENTKATTQTKREEEEKVKRSTAAASAAPTTVSESKPETAKAGPTARSPSPPVASGSVESEEWRQLITEPAAATERAAQFRVLGNQKVAEKKYNEAEVAYTMGISQSKADALLFANRALSRLAQNRWSEAIEDTDYCLVLARGNVKALYRRAQGLLSRDAADLVNGPLALVTAERILALPGCDAAFKAQVNEWKAKALETLQKSQPKDAHEQFLAAQTTPDFQLVNFFRDPLKAARDAFQAGQYQHSVSIYEQILHLRPNHREAQIEVGHLWIKAGHPQRAIFHLTNALVLLSHTSAQLCEILNLLTKAFFDLKQPQMAYIIGAQLLVAQGGKQALTAPSREEGVLTAKAHMARAMRLNGDAASARMLLISNLQAFEDHKYSLDEYGRALEALGQPTEALRVYLKMMVLDMNNPDLKEHFASVLQHKEAYKFFREQLDPSERPEQFYSFIASGVKEWGAVQVSIDLYKACLEYKKNFPTYVLNLVHDLEVQNEYQEAFRLLKEHIYLQRDKYVGPVHMAAIWNMIRHIDRLEDHQLWKPKESRPNNTKAQLLPVVPGKVDMTKKYGQAELDLLATIFTLVKVCYIVGVLDILPDICKLTDTACEGRDIHDTVIKNENAYFSCITGLMSYHAKTIENPPSASMPRLYVAGDSHSMTPAWHTMNLRGTAHLVQPLLVTGMKIWHLRPASRFFPKNNFYNVVPRAPPKSTIVFLFGEIDCREGFLVSVQKCRYKDLNEAAQVTIDIYMDVLKSLVEKYDYEIFIHPIVPVLDATRHVVIPFMKLLVETIARVKALSQPGDWTHNIHMLDFFWKLVKEHKQGEPMPEYWGAPPKVPWFFEKAYDLDLTHMNPTYLPLLQDALNVSAQQADADPHPYKKA
jgi:tetratricopeptide (TPR) repeat protein